MSQNITFKIQEQGSYIHEDIKCDHLPKPADAWIKQAFSAKLLLDGKEYSTGPINGSTTTLWSSKITLQAPGSASLEIEVHNRINGRNKLVGSLKDTVHNFLKESFSETVARTLRKIDRRGVIRETTIELTFSIALLSRAGNADLPVSSFEQLEQPDTFGLFVGTAEWTHDPKEQEEDVDMYVEVSVDGTREVHRTLSAKTAHCSDHDLEITGRLESTVRIEIKSGAHISSKSLSVARVETSVKNLLEICANGDLATLELTLAPLLSATMDQATLTDGDAAVLGLAITPLMSGMVEPVAGTGGHMDSKHSAPNSIGRMTVKLCWQSHAPPQLPDISTVSIPQMSQLERRIPEDVEEDLKIVNQEQALALIPDGHPDKPTRLSNLGVGYITRFHRHGDLADLENSIASFEQGVALTPDGHPDKPSRLTNFGGGYLTRFQRLGGFADLENSIASHQQAVALTPDGHPDK
ncbi:hypothetical protein FIBSPDRAFT_934760, partial [Athelia psychrophila]